MTATATKEKKPIPAQADVRIVGGKTTVKLRAFGNATLDRMAALVKELRQNAATHSDVSKAATEVETDLVKLSLALGFQGLATEAGDEEAE